MSTHLFTQLDLSPERVRGFAAGLRPYRQGSPRLEVEVVAGKTIGHNYGHGGSGITMCWGSAAEMLELLGPALSQPSPVAVLGAGIMGLCTASLLIQAGHSVTVYAASFPPQTTSNLAGGLWGPTHVGASDSDQHERILRRAWQTFRQLESQPRYGIELVPLFESDQRANALDPMPVGLVDPPVRLERLPFDCQPLGGQLSSTLLIETPRFLQAVFDDVRDRGASIETRRFASPAEVQALEEPVVVDCLGLGAREAAADPLVGPIRGQLVLLEPAPRPFALDHPLGYLISRRDVLILGGTFEAGESDPTPQQETCQRILAGHRSFFGQSS